MDFNKEIIKAITSLLNEEIIALTARCRQNKILNLLCFMKSEIQVSYIETFISLRLMGSDTRHLASYVESGSMYICTAFNVFQIKQMGFLLSNFVHGLRAREKEVCKRSLSHTCN